jgi:transcriptional regulator with XRE-family HTH domain
MKTTAAKHPDLKAMMTAARKTHTFKVETAKMEFTEDLVRLMGERALSNSDLARAIDVNPAYITKILRGTSNFTLDTMVKIATALDCDYRSHLQPVGRKTQWFDVLLESPDVTVAYRPGDFRPVEISITPTAETRALAS